MPIHGRINARPERYRLGLIQVGEKVYLDPADVIVTRKGVILDLFSPIMYQEDIGPEDQKQLIHIKRIGGNITENDFNVKFPSTLNFQFTIRPNSLYYEALDDKSFNIIFHDTELRPTYEAPTLKKRSKEIPKNNLRTQLRIAVANENFEEAARLRDVIKNQKQKPKTQNRNPKS